MECNKEFGQLGFHLKKHNLTCEQYKKKYPDAKFYVVSEKRKENISEKLRMKYSEGKIRTRKGQKNTAEHNKKVSATMKARSCGAGSRNSMFGKSVLDVWKEKYGEEKAAEMWEKRCRNFSYIQTLNGYKEKYGDELGVKKYRERYDKTTGENNHWYGLTGELSCNFNVSIEDRWIKKYGYDVASKMWEQYCDNHLRGENHPGYGLTGELNANYGISILDKLINKYGEIEGIKRWKRIKFNQNTKNFVVLKNIVESMGYEFDTEYVIFDEQNMCYKIYDIHINSMNILVESDGTYWHAKDYYDGKKTFEELTFDQKKNVLNDQYKNELAERKGFKLIRIWAGEEESIREKLNSLK